MRAFETFTFHRNLTLDLLNFLREDQLSLAPIAGAGSFGKQFRHILDMERCYTDSMVTGSLDFFRTDINHTLENDKYGMIKALLNEDKRLKSVLSKIPEDELYRLNIDCSNVVKYVGEKHRKTSPEIVVSWIMEHELFHDGQLALYIRYLGMKFPESWMFWGLR